MKHLDYFALVRDYLAMRRNLGFSVERIRWLLRDFARFIGRIGHRGPITVDLAMRWALSSRSPDPARAERRLWAVRQFARHLAPFYPATEIPPAGLFGRITRRSQPHIYTELFSSTEAQLIHGFGIRGKAGCDVLATPALR